MSKNFLKIVVASLALVVGSFADGAEGRVVSVAEKSGAAIQRAIDEVAAAGGGKVVVPAGLYPSGTLYLKSHVELHLEKGAVVQGGTNAVDYASFPASVEPKMGRSLVQAWNAEDVAITGEGDFDCQGLAFFDATKPWQGRHTRFYSPRGGRPEMVLMFRCKNVRFEGVGFLNSPSWTMRLRLCENLDFRRIRVLNDLKFINADGIDFDGCRHVRLRDSDFLTGDDSIVLRAIRQSGTSPRVVTEDVVVEDCRLESACQCIRIGCPSDGVIRNARFRNLTLKGFNGINFDYPVRYLRADEEGSVDVHDVVFENVRGASSNCAVRINVAPGVKIRGVRDVLFKDFDVTSGVPLDLRGNFYSRIERIRRVNFKLNGKLLPDGEFAVADAGVKPLQRLKPGEYCYKKPVPYVPPLYVTVEEKTGAAIQRAIDQVATNLTGGVVTVPAGEYPSGSIRLRSHVELRLEKGCTVIGGTNHLDYFAFPSEVCAVKPERSDRVFFYAWDAEDFAITGGGTIEGRGPAFFDHGSLAWRGEKFWAKPAAPRPRMVQFVRCRNVRLDGVTFKDSPGWTMLIRQCEDVACDGIAVVADHRIINSDGIDFDGCRRVRVANSRFSTGDDCLIARAMRSPGTNEHVVCEDFHVNDCSLESACQCIRMGCPSDDTIRDVVFRDVVCKGRNGIYFNYPVNYLRPDDDGYMDIRDCLFENFTGELRGSAIQIDVDPGVKLRAVKDVAFRNFDVKSARPLRFVGNVHTRFENVTFDNVVVNGKRQRDGEVPGDYTAAGPLKRRTISWETDGKKKGK